ncbi:MAG TPA: type II CAAX endopeptidase family protein [Vicinamibacterales bacterium]|nr:type II CAAX endopeptidase family protein [Vicinamibacterales bacterium]
MIEPPVAGPLAVQPIPPIERIGAALEVILCSGFPTQLLIISVLSGFGMHVQTADGHYSAPFIFTLTLLDSALLIGLICFLLRARRESIRETLFGSRALGREMFLGLCLIPASFMIVMLALVIVQLVAPSLRNVPHNPLADLARTRGQAIVFACVVMIAGGVREEIQRGFILHRFEQFLGGGTVGLAVFSVLFGLGHLEQGYDVSLAVAILGTFWGAIYLRRRSIAGPMVSHAGFNLLQVVKFMVWGA